MSYDYDALCREFAQHRKASMVTENVIERSGHLQKAVQALETLSSCCPMTPALWIQYASTAAEWISQALLRQEDSSDADSRINKESLQTRLQTLELGLQEFPGYVLLHLHYIELLMHKNAGTDAPKIESALRTAIAQVGGGSHRNEGSWVVQLYNHLATFLVKQNRVKEALQCFVQRARIPMKDVNDEIASDYRGFCENHGLTPSTKHLEQMEQGRRLEAKLFNRYITLEDEIDAVMHSQGILPRYDVGVDKLDWKIMLHTDRYGMGLGGADVATAFVKYALECSNIFKSAARQVDEDDQDLEIEEMRRHISGLASAVFERGVAECPTVDSLWLSYIRFLTEQDNGDSLSLLPSVSQRAVRNCPYSQALACQQMDNVLLLADKGLIVFDPDALMEQVQTALDTKFLPNPVQFLELYLCVIRIVKRRMLSILSGVAVTEQSGKAVLRYDEAEPILKSSNARSPKRDGKIDGVLQEVQDLCEDLTDMYEHIEQKMRKVLGKWSEGRSLLWLERAYTEKYFLNPLRRIFEGSGDSSRSTEDLEMLLLCEKPVRSHSPPHPDLYLRYIEQYLLSYPVVNATDVLHRLRRTRWLYQKAIVGVGRSKESKPVPSLVIPNFDSAFAHLSHHWLEFEQMFGSRSSVAEAHKAIARKMHKLGENVSHPSSDPLRERRSDAPSSMNVHMVQGPDRKRKVHIDSDDFEGKRIRTKTDWVDRDITTDDDRYVDPGQSKNAKKPNQDFKYHPFSVRVSGLSEKTDDMDLVDVFRPKCGEVVHARIIREKEIRHSLKGKSKGWGLIQFEDRESTEKALALDGIIGIHEKLVVIERSYMPAVMIVPPGMHRVQPKGEGKSSKINERRKEREQKTTRSTKSGSGPVLGPLSEDSFNPLQFRPRGIQAKPRSKVSVDLQ